jgi:hypothetical protein
LRFSGVAAGIRDIDPEPARASEPSAAFIYHERRKTREADLSTEQAGA